MIKGIVQKIKKIEKSGYLRRGMKEKILKSRLKASTRTRAKTRKTKMVTARSQFCKNSSIAYYVPLEHYYSVDFP